MCVSPLIGLLNYFVVVNIECIHYYVCCRSGKYRPNKKCVENQHDKSIKRRKRKRSRKLNGVCVSRMYVRKYVDQHIELEYISVHTGHEVNESELAYLPLPKSTREAVYLKLSQGVNMNRIVEGDLRLSKVLPY